MNYLISVVIPTYNRLPILKLTLQAYEDQEDFGGFFEVIIVDDGSSDETWNYLAEYKSSRFSFSAHHQVNQGPAMARNLAISKAKGEYLVISGDDIIPSKDFLSKHYRAHQSALETIVLGKIVWHPLSNINSVMKHVDGVGAQQFSYYYMTNGMKLDFRHFYTSNISLNRRSIMKLENLFDTDFYLYGYEDVELGYRLIGNRDIITYYEDIIGYHHHSYTLESFCKRQYCAGRMACIFKDKHPSISDKIGFPELQCLIKSVNKKEKFLEKTIDSKKLQEQEEFIVNIFERYTNLDSALMNDVYLGLFKYFYFKGMLHGQKHLVNLGIFVLPCAIDIYLSKPINRFLTSEEHNLEITQINKLHFILSYCSKYTKKSSPNYNLNKIKTLLRPIKLKIKLFYLSIKNIFNLLG